MASVIHLDTHSVIWLHDGEFHRFPVSILPLIHTGPLEISPMVHLELHYLHEIGRLSPTPDEILRSLHQTLALKISASAFHSVVAEAASLAWTRDPFDRLICASARVAGASLLTKDAIILANEPNAFWDQPPVHPQAPHA